MNNSIAQHNKNLVLRFRTVWFQTKASSSSYFSDDLDGTKTSSDHHYYVTWLPKTANPIPLIHQTLKQCSKTGRVLEGKACHAQTIILGLKSDTLTSNMIVNMYSKCNLIEQARHVFDKMPERTSVSWNTIIGSVSKLGDDREALGLFNSMRRDSENPPVSEFAVSSVLCALAGNSSVFECRQLHGLAVKNAAEFNVFVGTALINVYAKSGCISDATTVFGSMSERTPVTYSSMVAGLVQNGCNEEALVVFRSSRALDLLGPDAFSVSSAATACSGLASLVEGGQIHAIALRSGVESNPFVACSLIDMYAKCGDVESGYVIFRSASKNVVVWNAMISGFARDARHIEAMVLFEKMQQTGLSPDEVSYVSVLSACAHVGLVENGKRYFALMKTQHGFSPNVVHYSAMVDILARAGLTLEAHDLVKTMPFDPTPPVWGSILASCRVHGNLELAETAAERLFELEPENAGNRVLLSNIYAANKKWEKVAETRLALKESVAKKERGKSWIEIKSSVHSFMVGERSHPRMAEIYAELEGLVEDLRKIGYLAKSEDDLHDVEESTKSELLTHHSEKLALTFGLMCLPSNAPIRIMKNLRICGDCHSFMKLASGFTGREIIVRDTNRFHRFKNGSCSCREFW